MAARESEKGVRVTTSSGPAGCLIRLHGVIDESLERSQLSAGGARVVVYDLDGVRRITSYGVREWMKGLSTLSADYAAFINCRPAIVSQFNMVSGFGGRGELLSFFAPYVCGQCGKEFDLLFDLRRDHEVVRSLHPPAVKCPSCGGPADFDEIPDSFFAYAAGRPAPQPPPELEALLRPDASAPAGGLRVRKQVEGTVTGLWFLGALDKNAKLRRLGDGLEGPVVVVANGIAHATAPGAAHLKMLLDTDGPIFFTARVGPALLRTLMPGKSRMVSVEFPAMCVTCGEVTPCEILGADLDSARAGGALRQKCPRCGGALRLVLDPETTKTLAGLSLIAAPAEIQAFLDRHPRPPQESGGDGPIGEDELTPTGQSFGRYQLLRLLGTGGMAEVFLARQTSVGGFEKSVVVKRILPHLSADEHFVHMFFEEARLAARISHPNVVQIFDLGQVGTRYYIAMEYVRGWDLAAILRLAGQLQAPLPIEVALRIIADASAGLHAAHVCTDEGGNFLGIVHRDVSPHNILISADGVAKISDFGVAKALDLTKQQKTPTDTLKGKIPYMAPEQVKTTGKPIDARVDVFALGIILYQTLTLEHLFRRDNEFATLRAILHDPVPPLTGRRPEAPPELDRMIAHALERNPEARYASALDLHQELEKVLRSLPGPATAVEVTHWVKNLVHQAEVRGQLPAEMAFTPSGKSPPPRETTAPTQPIPLEPSAPKEDS